MKITTFIHPAVFVLLSASPLDACTLWGAAGTNAAGGTIISKNRDWKPDHTQALKMHRSGKSYAYFGLYAVDGTEPGIKEGVNEKGLTVIANPGEQEQTHAFVLDQKFWRQTQ